MTKFQSTIVPVTKYQSTIVAATTVSPSLSNQTTTYKPTNIPWLGDIPTDWEVRKLKNLVQLNRSNAKSFEGKIALENIESWTGSYIKSELNFEGDGVEFENGDVLFNKLRPYLAKVFLPTFDGLCVNELLVLKPNLEFISTKFLYLVISNPVFIDMVDSSTYGSKMPRANWDYIGSIPLPLPPLETQTAIASYLDAKCELIAKYISDKTKIINLLREQKKSLIYNAVTGKIMIKLNGDTVVASTVSAITTPSQNSVAATTVSPSRSNPTTTYKPTNIPWLGDIPTDWVVRRLKGVLKNLTDGSHISVKSVNEGYPYITVTNIDQKTRNIDLVNCQKISLKDYEQLVKNGCKPDIGDVLFSQIGTIGLTVEVKLNSDFVMLSSLAILKPNANQISNSFLIYTLLSDLIIQQYSLAMAGGAVKRITLNHISQFQIPLPPLQTQHQIVAYLDTQTAIIDNTITKIQKEIELIQEYKKSLIYNAVTGKKLIYT